jgi:hypothetical protein
MIAISDERVLELARREIAAAVEKERPMVREQFLEQFKWVTDSTGSVLLDITGKDPLRTFRRLMNQHGVATLTKIDWNVRYRWSPFEPWELELLKKNGNGAPGISICELVAKHVIKAKGRGKTSNVQRSTSNAELQIVQEDAA